MISLRAWGTSHLVILPHCTRSAPWRHGVESLGTIVVSGEWSMVLTLHCSRTVAVCPRALQALTALPAHTSCRPMMTLTSGIMETCALGTCVTSCTGRLARLFSMLEAHDP
jgi:hypothetical protein